MCTCPDGFHRLEIANWAWSCQNRGSKSRDFYATTVAALNAKERSDQATQQKLVDAQRDAQAPFKSESPLPVAKPPEEEQPSKKRIAGRKRVKSGEKWDKGAGKELGTAGDRAADAKDVKTVVVETNEEHELEVELNSILKKGPSQCNLPPLLIRCDVLTPDSKFRSLTLFLLCSSHHFLQNLLSAFQKGQIHPTI